METTAKETILKEILHRHNKLGDVEGIERGEYKEELEIIYEAMEEYKQLYTPIKEEV